jgi:hypothetical protein
MTVLIRAGRILALLLMLLAVPAQAQEPTQQEIAELARDVDRTESLRAVKNLQRTYAQYAQYGLWSDMGALFANDGRFVFDGQVSPGETFGDPQAIAAFLRARYGGGEDGLAAGVVSTMLIDAPLISLSPDGESAKGRWSVIMLLAQDGKARIEGGLFENEYVRRDGKWQISLAHYYPQYDGPYETGWTNWGGGDLPIVPYHFTPDSAGTPIPPAEGPAPATTATLGDLSTRIAALNTEDEVRNLQAALGYYIDRKMWDDVADMFDQQTGDVLTLGPNYQAAIWPAGRDGVKLWLEATMGPAGLEHGQLNDRVQFDVTIDVLPNGKTAYVRGIELGMLGEADQEKGWWSVSDFQTTFVRRDGVWVISEYFRFPLFRSDYDLGWGKDRYIEPLPTGAAAPRIIPTRNAKFDMLTFRRPHPVTGKLVGQHLVPLPARPEAEPAKERPLTELRRRLARSTAYDGTENVSAAYTAYLDDLQSDKFGALIAEDGFKMSAFAGYYVGRDRVTEAGVRVWGTPPVMRPGVHFHWRVQPVILVSEDGRSVNMRVRLFQPRTGKEVGGPGGWYGAYFISGMYHDQFVLEDGVWRMFNLSLDEPYMSNVAWKVGWHRAKDPETPRTGAVSRLIQDGTFLPDVPVTALGKRQEHFWGGTGEAWQWPTILPMWFEYVNPVSGRVPEFYQEDCAPCLVRPDLRLDRNGFQQPPVWPQVAGE